MSRTVAIQSFRGSAVEMHRRYGYTNTHPGWQSRRGGEPRGHKPDRSGLAKASNHLGQRNGRDRGETGGPTICWIEVAEFETVEERRKWLDRLHRRPNVARDYSDCSRALYLKVSREKYQLPGELLYNVLANDSY